MKFMIVALLLVAGFSSYAETLSRTSVAAGLSSTGLAAALQAVILNHPAIKGKQAELNSTDFAIQSAKAARYPTLSIAVSDLEEHAGYGTIQIDQPLWRFGKISTQIQHAKAENMSEHWAFQEVQRGLIEKTAVAYAKIEGIKVRARIVEQNIAEHKQLHNRIVRREHGKLASEADVSLSSSRLIQAQAQRQQIEGELLVALSDLYALTQVHVSAEEPIEKVLAILPEASEVERSVLENNASINNKRERIEMARLASERERLASYPDLSFRVEQDIAQSEATRDETRYGLVLQANFEGLGVVASSRRKASAMKLSAAKQDMLVVYNDVQRQINSFLINRQLQRDLAAKKVNVVNAVKATVSSFTRQYLSGRKSWVDVLNVQRELTEARLSLAQSQNEWLILSLRLAVMMGTLDEMAGVKMSGENS